MSRWLALLVCLLLFAGLFFILKPDLGFGAFRQSSGIPDTTRFGYGARLAVLGSQAELSVAAAASIHLDWVGLNLSWNQIQAQSGLEPDFTELDQIIRLAGEAELDVLISISEAPPWAMADTGPNPGDVSRLLQALLKRYPGQILAIELFPAANTTAGWGAPPNPLAYAAVLQAAHLSLRQAGSQVWLVGAGLEPLPQPAPPGTINDLDFLRQLYSAGAADWMPIVGIRFQAVDPDLMAVSSLENSGALRHYELVRQVMLEMNHSSGLIWITGFSWPVEVMPGSEETDSRQARWLESAYSLLQAQLYIGAAFYGCLNAPGSPAVNSLSTANTCLIGDHGGVARIHPAALVLSNLIYTTRTGRPPKVEFYLDKKAVNAVDKARVGP